MKNFKNYIGLILCAFVLVFPITYAQQYLPTNISVDNNSGDQSETAVTVDINNSNHLMTTWNDFSNGTFTKPGFGFSTDGGKSWATGTISPSIGYGFDPSCAIDRNGNEYYTYGATSSPGSLGPIYLSVSTDNGANWATHQVSTSTSQQDKPYMTVDNTGGTYDGRLYAAWTDFSSGTAIRFAYSTNQGSSWTQTQQALTSYANSPGNGAIRMPESINQGNQVLSGSFVQDAVPAVGPDGTIYVAYLYASGGTGSSGTIYVEKSTNGGQSFNTPVVAASITVVFSNNGSDEIGSMRVSSYPTIAVDPSSGNIYVAYTQYDNGDYNIYFTSSTNKNTTWSTPIIATQTSSGYQFFPWLTVNSSGVVSLTYYQGTSTSADVYEAESYNDGQTFYGADIKVTSSSGNPSQSTWTSDYLGSTSISNRNVFPFWTDFRSGSNADVYTGLYNSVTRLAYNNISFDYDATGDNHNRSLAKGNNLYEAFSSGGEIFVRQSSNNGFSWNYTTRISTGNGNNSVPSIVVYPVSGTTDTVNVVWERSLGSNYYDIYYSMSGNSGASWSSPILLENSVLVSSYQYGGPQPVICGISSTPKNPPYSPIQPMLPASYMHGILVVYTSNNGLYYTYEYNYPGWGWSAPASITTSAPGSYIWYPSLASSGGNVSPYANLSYDARYYHKIYSNYFTASSNTWSTEAVVYDGSNQMSYDRQSCIAAGGAYIFDAWNSYNSTYGYYTVKFRQGNYPNSWQSWEWTYPGTTANYFFPSISAYYNGSEYVAITDYTSPGNQILYTKEI